jgi:hypothetical protein
VHEIKRLVDIGKGEVEAHKFVHLQLASLVIIDKLGHAVAAFPP